MFEFAYYLFKYLAGSGDDSPAAALLDTLDLVLFSALKDGLAVRTLFF